MIKLKKWKIVLTEKLIYKSKKYAYEFRKFQTIRTFGKDIYEGEITFEESDEDQSDLMNETENFRDKTRPKSPEKKQEKKMFLKTRIFFLRVGKKFLVLLKVKYF